MPIILRTQKGKQLTIQELDGNFENIDTRLRNIENSNDGTLDLTVVTLSSSGEGLLEYNSASNLLVYTPPDLSEFLTEETDPIFTASPAGSITATDISNWNAAYNWGDHSQEYALIENIPQNISDLSDISTANPQNGQVLKWDGFQWIPSDDTTSEGTGIEYTDLSVSTNTAGTASLTYDNTTGIFTFTPPDLSLYLTSVSLNQINDVTITSPNTGEVLKFNGTIWTNSQDDTGENGGIALDDLSVTIQPAGNANLSYDNTTGLFAYTPPDLSVYALSSSIPNSLIDLGIVDGTNGQVLTTDGSGNFTFTTVSGVSGTLNDLSDVDTTGAIDGSVLKYSSGSWIIGTDNDSLGGITLDDLSVAVQPVGNANLSYDNTTGVFAYTPPDLSSYLTSVAFADLTSSPTTLSGYGITDALTIGDLGDFSFLGTTIDTAASAPITVTPDITFNGSVEFTTLASTGTGTLTLDSASSITLTAADNITLNAGVSNSVVLGSDLDLNGNTVKYSFVLGADGTSNYTFNDPGNIWFPTTENDPVLYLRRGETYVFTNNSGGSHPFEIRVSNGGAAYNTGVTNNGSATGDIIFKVPMSAPATLYYQCTFHSTMGNTINIV